MAFSTKSEVSGYNQANNIGFHIDSFEENAWISCTQGCDLEVNEMG